MKTEVLGFILKSSVPESVTFSKYSPLRRASAGDQIFLPPFGLGANRSLTTTASKFGFERAQRKPSPQTDRLEVCVSPQ